MNDKKIKVKNKETGVTKEVTEALAGELIGTKEWEIVKETQKPIDSFSSNKNNENK